MRKTILSLCLMHSFFFISAQQDRALLAYNVGFGGVTAGIGAVINKPKGADWKKTFLKGVWQGSIGGILNYTGKKTAYLINQNRQLWYGWPSKLFHSAGTSIIENAALGEPFLQNWNIDYGPVRIDFSLQSNRPTRLRLLAYGIYAIVQGSRYGYLDLKASLLTGNLTYKSDAPYYIAGQAESYKGLSFLRGYIYSDRDDMYQTIPHELIHGYQHRDHLVFNTWLKPLAGKVRSRTLHRIFDRYIYADIPFFTGFYALQPYSLQRPYINFYEFEAQRFATNKDVAR